MQASNLKACSLNTLKELTHVDRSNDGQVQLEEDLLSVVQGTRELLKPAFAIRFWKFIKTLHTLAPRPRSSVYANSAEVPPGCVHYGAEIV